MIATQNPIAVDAEGWLDGLMNRELDVELVVCRYHCRRGEFSGMDRAIGEHMVTFVEQGHLPVRVDDTSMRLQSGDALWIPPGSYRQYYGKRNTPLMRHYNLRFSLKADGRHLCLMSEPTVIHNAWEMQSAIQMLHDLHHHGHLLSEARKRALLTLVSTSFMAMLQQERGGTWLGRILTPGQRQRLNRFIVDHVDDRIAPYDLAKVVQLSLDYFTRLFRRTYGLAPRYYLKHERMRVAAIQLRETDSTVAAVAREVGTENVSLFCRQFRDVMGCTPSEYRLAIT